MGEFKAQILGIILVLGIFGVLAGPVKNTFTNAWTKIATQVSTEISNAITPPPT